mgnify:CR=1 FL=1
MKIRSLLVHGTRREEHKISQCLRSLGLCPKTGDKTTHARTYIRTEICTHNWIQAPRVATRSSLPSPHEYRQVQGCPRGLGSLKTAVLSLQRKKEILLFQFHSRIWGFERPMPRADTRLHCS